MTTRTTVRLPDDLLAQAKRKAIADGRTFTSLVEEGLRTVVAGVPKDQRPRVLPPISSAKGGLQPGIDALSFSAVEEQDDADYFERLKTGFR